MYPDEQIWNLLGYTPEEIDGCAVLGQTRQRSGGDCDTIEERKQCGRNQWFTTARARRNGGFRPNEAAPVVNGQWSRGGE